MSSSTLFFGTTQTKTVTQNGTYYEYVKDITGNGKSCAVKISNIGSDGGTDGSIGFVVNVVAIKTVVVGNCKDSTEYYQCCVFRPSDTFLIN